MDVFSLFSDRVEAAIEELKSEGVLPADLSIGNLSVEPPRNPAHGDIAVNAAMVLAKQAGLPPRQLADKFAERVSVLRDDVERLAARIGRLRDRQS